MTTQRKNLAEREPQEKAAKALSGARDVVESFVDSLHANTVAPVQELMDYTPVIRGMVIGYVAGVLTVLISLLAARQ